MAGAVGEIVDIQARTLAFGIDSACDQSAERLIGWHFIQCLRGLLHVWKSFGNALCTRFIGGLKRDSSKKFAIRACVSIGGPLVRV